MAFESRALSSLKEIFRTYFVDRDYSPLLSHLSPRVAWFGTGSHEVAHSRAKVALLLEAERLSWQGHFDIIQQHYRSTAITPDCCCIQAELHLRQNDSSDLLPMELLLRISCVCCEAGDSMRIEQLHTSTPNTDQAEQEYVPSQRTAEQNQRLRALLDKRTRELNQRNLELNAVLDNMPGAVCLYHLDDALTLTFCSAGFLSLIGRDSTPSGLRELMLENEAGHALANRQLLLQANQDIELEYQVRRPDGSSCWLLEKGRRLPDGQIHAVLVDIGAHRQQMQVQQRNADSYRQALGAMYQLVFEVELERDSFMPITDVRSHIDIEMTSSFRTNAGRILRATLPEDQEIVRQTYFPECIHERLQKNTGIHISEYRKSLKQGGHEWRRCITIPVLDDGGVPDRLIFCVSSIDEQKRQQERIHHEAQTDHLTQLLNKFAIETRIEDCLQQDPGHHALLIIDIDNFKDINDTFGHLFGDAVLANLAMQLQQHFRSGDLLGRIGGDEFLVFMRHVGSPVQLVGKARELCQALRKTFRQTSRTCQISASIGIACTPEHGAHYTELFTRADQALYHVKAMGKNHYALYSPKLHDVPAEYHSQRAAQEPSATIQHDDSLFATVLELLYQARDMDTVLELILDLLGNRYKVSRCYVFEKHAHEPLVDNTYEWCAPQTEAMKPKLQNFPYSNFSAFLSHFGPDGVFNCSNISELEPDLRSFLRSQGITAILLVAIIDTGELRGFVGFDDCQGSRQWSDEEIGALSTLSKLIGTFLLKARLAAGLQSAHNNLQAILDSVDNATYVMDCDTHRLLYLNRKTHELVPTARVDDLCHEAFFDGCVTPCEHCPLPQLSASSRHARREVYNPSLGIWSDVQTSLLSWCGHEHVALINCIDITRYKLPEQTVISHS
ncbi:diguanylate cyclase [Laribacter hongkongensis]|uniref:sensor domain-containing diguanylate cyclase n=1 Tax=Laribacter hongkongensis TaxID=168471 RepID=UPI001EFECC99|nr:diguanylate cyclase [Laribacter hongkongensis]MCG9123934.1 diguanylate cyclase [Laribacter hongkongensis]